MCGGNMPQKSSTTNISHPEETEFTVSNIFSDISYPIFL